MDFDLRAIRSFEALAEHLSFTKASEQLGVTQSHFSSRIKGLEAQLGFALFTRTSRRVELTWGGQVFLASAKKFLREARELEQVGRGLREGRSSSIRIGTGKCDGEVRWALLDRFVRDNPQIQVRVNGYRSSSEISDALRTGEVDAALIVPPIPDEFKQLSLSSALGGLICRLDSPFGADRAVHPADLAGRQIAIFPREVYPILHDAIVDRLEEFGAWFCELPDTGVECLSSFVRTTGIPAIRMPWWRSEQDRPKDLACRFIEGCTIPLDTVMIRPRGRTSEPVDLLWQLGRQLAAHRSVADGQHAPARGIPIRIEAAP